MRALRSLVTTSLRPRCALALVAALVFAACGHGAPARPDPAPAAEQEDDGALQDDASIEVDNRNWSDIVVFVIANNGQKMRIGSVNAATKSLLVLPARYIAGSATIQLVARPIGGWGEFRSERFVVQRGQEVVWTLESGLERSSLAVY